jgi:hypothetical protein
VTAASVSENSRVWTAANSVEQRAPLSGQPPTGVSVGKSDGKVEGLELGTCEGVSVGMADGEVEGVELGSCEGVSVGMADGS